MSLIARRDSAMRLNVRLCITKSHCAVAPAYREKTVTCPLRILFCDPLPGVDVITVSCSVPWLIHYSPMTLWDSSLESYKILLLECEKPLSLLLSTILLQYTTSLQHRFQEKKYIKKKKLHIAMTSRKLHPMSRYTVFTPGDCNSNLAPLALIPLDTGIAIESSDYTFFVVIPPDSVRDKVFHIPTVTEKAFYVNYGITTHLGIATACVIDPEWQVFASLIPNQRNFQTKKHEYFQWWEINQFFGGFITSLIRPYNTTRNRTSCTLAKSPHVERIHE